MPNGANCLLGVPRSLAVLPFLLFTHSFFSMRALQRAVLGCIVLTLGSRLRTQVPSSANVASPPAHDTLFYRNGALKLEAYLYKPEGAGPFPLVIYNHGSRAGGERVERPFFFVGQLLTAAGYAVLVPERRGYGKSDGKPFSEEIGPDRGSNYVKRLRDESDDVLAAIPILRTYSWVDTARIAIMGWSFGGSVSVFAASKEPRFFAVIDQAGGALTWPVSPALRKALPEAATHIHSPLLCMGAENDAATDNVRDVCSAAKSHGASATVIMYEPFFPAQPARGSAPGHAIFSAEGVSHWSKDVLAFLEEHRPRN